MGENSIVGRLVSAASAQTLRVLGGLTVCLSVGIAAMSMTTEYGLAVAPDPGTQTTAYVADVGAVAALVEFATAHPAYPVAVVIGLVLVVAGDEVPLLGG